MTIDWTKPLELLDGTPVIAVMGSASGPPGIGPSKDTSHRWLLGHPEYPCGCHVSEDDPSWLRNRKEVAEVPTIRDQFAMAALTGIVGLDDQEVGNWAEWAYSLADMMLAARDK